MNLFSIISTPSLKGKIHILLPFMLSICVSLTIILDLAESTIQETSFYLSESLLFSSFWLLFPPILSIQLLLINGTKKTKNTFFLVFFPVLVHLISYPALVWVISKLFLNHDFAYWQTFNYELAEYSFVLLAIYSCALLLYLTFKSKTQNITLGLSETPALDQNKFVQSFLVTHGNKRTTITIVDILYIRASSPYILINHQQKKYLHSETLKSVAEKLDNNTFVRIHKSIIINIKMVQSYKSRLNGDYDITMNDGTILRLSRTYSSRFRCLFQKIHQDTVK